METDINYEYQITVPSRSKCAFSLYIVTLECYYDLHSLTILLVVSDIDAFVQGTTVISFFCSILFFAHVLTTVYVYSNMNSINSNAGISILVNFVR